MGWAVSRREWRRPGLNHLAFAHALGHPKRKCVFFVNDDVRQWIDERCDTLVLTRPAFVGRVVEGVMGGPPVSEFDELFDGRMQVELTLMAIEWLSREARLRWFVRAAFCGCLLAHAKRRFECGGLAIDVEPAVRPAPVGKLPVVVAADELVDVVVSGPPTAEEREISRYYARPLVISAKGRQKPRPR